MTRKEAREILMQGVFQMEIQKDNSVELFENFIKEKKLSKNASEYVRNSFEMIRRYSEQIDDMISKYAEGWSISRMPKTDLAILRVAVSELMYSKDIPSAVVINEAVEMSKTFCDDKSRKFINGILGNIEKEINKEEIL